MGVTGMEIKSESVPSWAIKYRADRYRRPSYAADCVGFAVDQEAKNLKAMVVVRGKEPFAGLDAWPGGFMDWDVDRTARDAVLRELREETGQGGVEYLEALDTYDTNGRDPRQFAGYVDPATGGWVDTGTPVVSRAFLALLRQDGRVLRPEEGEDAAVALWRSVYEYLPWEDLRTPAGRAVLRKVVSGLRKWAEDSLGALRYERLKRLEYAFGRSLAEWNEERVSERYALLMEAGYLEEAWRDKWGRVEAPALPSRAVYGRPMAFDHRQMLADALGRLRGKIKYMPALLYALMDNEFTLGELRTAVEAIAGRKLHPSNFAAVVSKHKSSCIVRPLDKKRSAKGVGRPGRLYTFVDDVFFARLDTSIKFPWLPT